MTSGGGRSGFAARVAAAVCGGPGRAADDHRPLPRHAAADVRLVLDPGGKPRLATPNGGQGALRFNLAHSGELALVACRGVRRGCRRGAAEAGAAIGRHRQRYSAPANGMPSGGRASAECGRVSRCWTGKEAVLKAIGAGLGHPLETFDVSAASPSGGWIELPPRRTAGAVCCWLVPLTPCDTYVGAVACVESRAASLATRYLVDDTWILT